MELRLVRPWTVSTTRSESSWRDPRLWLGIVLVATSVVVANAYTHRLGHRTFAYAAAHDIAAGTELAEGDLRTVAVALPEGVNAVVDPGELVGRVLMRDMAAGDMLMPSSVADVHDRRARTVSVPVRAGHLPALHHGAQVEIWMTPSLQGAEAPGPARLVVDVATVVAAPDTVDATMDAAVSLLVNDSEVGDLVQAMRDGNVDVVMIGQAQ